MTGKERVEQDQPTVEVTADKCAERLKAVADPDRLRIVECLQMGALTVGDIAEILSMEVVRVSHHLGVLRTNAILLVEKQGRHRVYRLNPELLLGLKAKSLNFGCCRLELDAGWKPE